MKTTDSATVSATDTLQAIFDKGCNEFKHKVAFKCATQSITYLELEQGSRQFAAYLQTNTDLRPGDRIAIQLPNCIAYPVLTWGALRAGLVVVNVNPLYTKTELAHLYKDSGAKALILLSSSIELVSSLLSETDISTLVYLNNLPPALERLNISAVDYHDALEQGSQCHFQPVVAEPGDMALLQYTGGTTGLSKGAILSHHNLISAARGFWNATGIFEPGNETFVAPLPLYHVYAFVAHIVLGVAYGVTSILISDPRDINSFTSALENTRFTLFVGINTLFSALCQDQGFRKLDFSALKFTLSGGMALDVDIAKRWHALTACEINEGYGLTESSAGVILNSGEQCRREGSVGKPIGGIKLKIVGDSGQELKVGEKGELHLKGDQIMQGYWHNPEATNSALKDGWLATGDIARIDEDGFVYIVDRIKDVIIVSGFNVYPAEIEQVVNRINGVQECAVTGGKTEDSGETVQLFVVLKDDIVTTEAILKHCREHLAAYKIPKTIKVVDELPKSPVGKILKRMLKTD
ncbi:AMP-binding protein [Lacimicrobium alkaliphilum]|uniref:Long-chain-fatty-acid--CoA ligase n=1 Tax=Lacimicrobium alkaliphilum TaxID=1526571 RepID=A0ABQ1R912_9ALTE|nr:AMP-binding protein [Lacimicrobium alkaliphilum]GGD60569.1 long-chain-fatty-acid--CoA ligase [Lacimicrobium alkaliphilum]